jgi:hypothetical protein
MAYCDNVFCTGDVSEHEHVALAGRKFCSAACAEDWYQQNEALAEPAGPSPARRDDFANGSGGTLNRPQGDGSISGAGAASKTRRTAA